MKYFPFRDRFEKNAFESWLFVGWFFGIVSMSTKNGEVVVFTDMTIQARIVGVVCTNNDRQKYIWGVEHSEVFTKERNGVCVCLFG